VAWAGGVWSGVAAKGRRAKAERATVRQTSLAAGSGSLAAATSGKQERWLERAALTCYYTLCQKTWENALKPWRTGICSDAHYHCIPHLYKRSCSLDNGSLSDTVERIES
jgi:hypothetical protein